MPTAAFTRLTTQALKELHNTRALVIAAMCVALHVVLNQFTIPVSAVLEIGFDFLALAAAGCLCGPWLAGLAGAAGDVLGYFLRPNGQYFPGFTLSAILMGILYGLWLYKKPASLWRCIAAQLSAVLLFNFFLTPLWLHMMYGQAFVLLSGMRLIKNLVQFPFSVALLVLVLKACRRAGGSMPDTTRS